MKRKVLTTAVLAAIATPFAVAGEVTIYGQAHVASSLYSSDIDIPLSTPAPAWVVRFACGSPCLNQTGEGWDLSTHASYIGFKGSEDLGNGLKAIWQMELQLSLTDVNGTSNDGDPGTTAMRNSFIGLSSPWGTLMAGRHDTPHKMSTARLDLFEDTVADYNANAADDPLNGAGNLPAWTAGASLTNSGVGIFLAGQGLGFVDIRADSAISYISPSWNGLTIAGAIIQPGLDTTLTATDSDGFAEGYSIAAMYANGPFYGSVSYEVISEAFVEEHIGAFTTDFPFLNDDKKWRVGLGYSANGIHVGYVYEDQDHPIVGVDAERWQLSGSYTFGNNVIKAMYGELDVDVSGSQLAWMDWVLGASLPDGFPIATSGYSGYDVSQWAVGFEHNFSRRTQAYIVYTEVDVDQGVTEAPIIMAAFPDGVREADYSALSIGLKHSF